MSDYEQEKWVELYRTAMVEFEHALVAGRLVDAHSEILKRVEKLRDIPGLHREERQATEDALGGLRILEREEVRYAAEQHRKVAQSALEKLRAIGPKIERLEFQQSDGS